MRGGRCDDRSKVRVTQREDSACVVAGEGGRRNAGGLKTPKKTGKQTFLGSLQKKKNAVLSTSFLKILTRVHVFL